MQQEDIDYIVCDDEVGAWADIFNVVFRKFIEHEDVLLLSPNLVLLPGTMEKLKKALYSGENVGAVCPVKLIYGSHPEWNTVEEAICYADQNDMEERYSLQIGLPSEGVLLSHKFIQEAGGMNQSFLLPYNIMVDISFWGIQNGYQYFEVENAFIYQLAPSAPYYEERYGENIDRERMKEKWKMNYFNDYPNEELLDNICEEEGTAFNLLEIGCDCGANLLYVTQTSHINFSYAS